MYLNYPIRKDFVLPFITTKGKIIIKYKQATIEDQIILSSQTNEWVTNSILELINDAEFIFDRKKWAFEPEFLYKKKIQFDKIQMLKELNSNFPIIIKSIIDTKYRKHKSLFSFLTADSWARKSIFNADVSVICEKFNIRWPNELISNYTLEQLEWLNDWLMFISHEYNDKDKVKNDRIFKWDLKSNDLDKLRKFRDLYNNSWNIKLKNNGNSWGSKGNN